MNVIDPWQSLWDRVSTDPAAQRRVNGLLYDIERALEEVKGCLEYADALIKTSTPKRPQTETTMEGYVSQE